MIYSGKVNRMSHKLLISYDLNKPGQHYSNVIGAIKSLGPTIKMQRSVWLTASEYSINKSRGIVRKQMDDNDLLLVIELTDANYNVSAPAPEDPKSVRALKNYITTHMKH